ncbi:MAG: 4Fe-4S binding protein [Eubacteriales bacterium]|nr:4Fe-4S binding protein [Eubacteriales bacterium]
MTINKNARCIGCLECVRACANMFFKRDDAEYACLNVVDKKGKPTPVVCIQCGKCAQVCPQGAISKNDKGVYIISKKLCTNCGLCRDACPLHVMVASPIAPVTSKCISCGVCAKACPMDVILVCNP